MASGMDKAAAAKAELQKRLLKSQALVAERRAWRERIHEKLADESTSAEEKAKLEAEAAELEAHGRKSRKRYTKSDFEPLIVVGKGAFGEVQIVRSKEDGAIFAMKTMKKEVSLAKNQTAHVLAEREALVDVLDKWVVGLHFSFQDHENLYLVMDFMSGGDLMGMLIAKDIFTEEATKVYAAEMIQAIEAVHAAGFVHRDLKPDNFLIDGRGHIKLTDMGLAKKIDGGFDDAADEAAAGGGGGGVSDGAGSEAPPGVPIDAGAAAKAGTLHRPRALAKSTVGTPDYIAPDVLRRKGYGKEVDWWSLGAILYECLLGYPPFYADDPVGTCRKILNWQKTLGWPHKRTSHLSPECLDFVQKLLCEPADRLGTVGGAKELKRHPWMKGVDWSALGEGDGPYVTDVGKRADEIMDRLAGMDRADPGYDELVKQLAANFEDHGGIIKPGAAAALTPQQQAAADAAAIVAARSDGAKRPTRVVGYTYKKGDDGELAAAGGGRRPTGAAKLLKGKKRASAGGEVST